MEEVLLSVVVMESDARGILRRNCLSINKQVVRAGVSGDKIRRMKTTVRRSGSAAAQQHVGAIGAAPVRVAAPAPGRSAARAVVQPADEAAVPGRVAAPLPPRRTQAQRRAQAEQRLLDAALEIVARTGSVRMTLAQVGEAAGYSRGLAAHRFGSKAGLLRALAAHINARFVAQIPTASANLSGLAVIRRNIRVYFERTDRTWTTTRALLVMMTEGFMEGSAMRGDLAEYNRAALAALEKHIRIGIGVEHAKLVEGLRRIDSFFVRHGAAAGGGGPA